jgi:hypothetical protein
MHVCQLKMTYLLYHFVKYKLYSKLTHINKQKYERMKKPTIKIILKSIAFGKFLLE